MFVDDQFSSTSSEGEIDVIDADSTTSEIEEPIYMFVDEKEPKSKGERASQAGERWMANSEADEEVNESHTEMGRLNFVVLSSYLLFQIT